MTSNSVQPTLQPLSPAPSKAAVNETFVIKDHNYVASIRLIPKSKWRAFLLNHLYDYIKETSHTVKKIYITRITSTWRNSGGIFVTSINNKYIYETNMISQEKITKKSLQNLSQLQNEKKLRRKKKQCEIPIDPISTTITTQSPPPLTISPCTTTSDMLLLGQNVEQQSIAEIILRKYGLYKGSVDYKSLKSLSIYYQLKHNNHLDDS